MHLLCPHCHNPIELADLHSRTEIVCAACGSSFSLERDSTVEWPGHRQRTIGRFEILTEVGRGAFGTVYKARDPELDRIVAVKVPRAGNLTSRDDADRFLREARSVAQLRHPGIVPVHEVGQQNELPFLVCDFVQGVTLTDLLSGRRPTFREAANLIATVADSLQYAHERGIVHRDVKPSNIMLGEDGQPHLMDFGLAKRDAGEITMTLEGQVLGTPAYMSPEQARGEGHQVDGRSDVYSLGVILYVMLTGELPFRGNPRMLLHQVLHDEPKPPRSLNDRIPRDLETVCLKAMAKEPARRYQSARDLADDLRRYLKGEPVLARPVRAWERGWRWMKRRPAIASLLLGLMLITALGIAGISWQWLRAEENASDEKKARQEAADKARDEKEQRQIAEEHLERAEFNLYGSRLAQAELLWKDNQVSQALQMLDECPPKHRAWEWHYLRRKFHGEAAVLQGHWGEVVCSAWSPDGKRLASASWIWMDHFSQLKVFDVETGREVFSKSRLSEDIHALAFTPDGKELLSAGNPVRVTHTGNNTTRSFLAEGVLRVWDVPSQKEIRTVVAPAPRLRQILLGVPYHSPLVFSADARRLAWVGKVAPSGKKEPDPREPMPRIKVWDTKTGKEILSLDDLDKQAAEMSVAFSPDGQRLAIFINGHTIPRAETTIQLRDVESGRLLTSWKLGMRRLVGMAFHPDGRLLATAGNDYETGSAGLIEIWDTTTTKSVLNFRTGNLTSAPAYSSDGRLLACADPRKLKTTGEVLVWDAHTGELRFTLRGHTDAIGQVSFRPDGKRLASAGDDATLRIWDLEPPAKRAIARAAEILVSPDASLRVEFARPEIKESRRETSFDVYEIAGGRKLRSFSCAGEPSNVTFLADSRRIAWTQWQQDAKSKQSSVRFFVANVQSGDVQRVGSLEVKANHWYSVKAFFSPDGRWVALLDFYGDELSSFDAKVDARCLHLQTGRVWDLPPVATVSYGATLAWSPDSSAIAGIGETRSTWLFPKQGLFVFDVHKGEARFVHQETLSGPARRATAGLHLAFSPDGARLATVNVMENRVKLWDAHTGRELRSWRSPASRIYHLTFSPDGRRLLSSGDDNVVRLWDTSSGQQVLALRDLFRFAPQHAGFSSDGRRLWLISGTEMRVLDTALPPSPIAAPLVRSLFAEVGLRSVVSERLKADASLEEDVRAAALDFVEKCEESSAWLNEQSWEVVSEPGRDAAAYRLALRQAEQAVRLEPEYAAILNTLGVAQYRSGAYRAALETLSRSNQSNKRSRYEDLAFLAMTHVKLNQPELARKFLDELRQVMKRPDMQNNREAQQFLREAEEVVGTAPKPR